MRSERRFKMKKNLIFIGGAFGVGKSACAAELKKLLPCCACLEGDACVDLTPRSESGEVRALAFDNISHLLGNFLACGEVENVVLLYSLHDNGTAEELLARLDSFEFDFFHISLVASPETVSSRLAWDVRRGNRRRSQIALALELLPLYDSVDSVKLATDSLTPRQVAASVAKTVSAGVPLGHMYSGEADTLLRAEETL